MKPRDVKPLQKLAKASASCSKEAAAYGACVNAKYLEVEKDMCKAEFETFKACVSKAMGKKW
ncbi:hypothetical protein P389DRAFT_173175 [Cystobasidium minutum MCA 4210]|uniref:uncharacterized protein n=1 Tax=Cystobasidium minutum MCA 4210 TaxID=1397322 RepID=UPI0034CD5EF9|eukprot:jgi/Rhomi1/173175/fgenesh1_kg.5_\